MGATGDRRRELITGSRGRIVRAHMAAAAARGHEGPRYILYGILTKEAQAM